MADRNVCFFAFLFCIVLALPPLLVTGTSRIVFQQARLSHIDPFFTCRVPFSFVFAIIL
jgi:hypothetical protein